MFISKSSDGTLTLAKVSILDIPDNRRLLPATVTW